ncbi:MAG: 50S ribosomal protein L29 [Anaerolineaceae bacterium]|nr:50S ribosomal protein L29 [Anaerolineaceae bacterium]
MKSADIRAMSVEDIQKKLNETRKEFMLLRFQSVSGQLTDTSKISEIKKIIARLETILREKQLSAKMEGEA